MALLGDTGLVADWWKSPNKAFNGETPEKVFQETPEEVQEYVWGFVSR